MMFSMSTLSRDVKGAASAPKQENQLIKSANFEDVAMHKALYDAGMSYFKQISPYAGNDLMKSGDTKRNIPGVIDPSYNRQVEGLKGILEPDGTLIRWGYDARGIREKYFNLSYDILRECAQKTGPVAAIQSNRKMQVRPFAQVSYNDNDIGFMAKLKDKAAVPDKKDKMVMKEIEEFFTYCGKFDPNLEDSEDREDFEQVIDMITDEVMTIDQVAISLRRNRKGKILDYWVLDGATIKRILKGREKNFGSDKARFVQEVDGRILEVFTNDDMIFTYMNRRTHLRRRGYGYSYLEQCIDMITAWLFGMSYNKELFNSSSQPKGILSFDGQQLDQQGLEELQREWISMFRGVKGMWKTPILQHNAKWIPIAPSNRDMEFNEYIQMLASWICAIHGMDPAEFGIKLNQTGASLNENKEAQIYYSKDRGLKDLLSFHRSWMNDILDKIPEWREKYYLDFTGMEAKSQKNLLEVDALQTSTFMTIDEKRKERDLPPLPNGTGKIIRDPNFIQYITQKEMAEQQGDGIGGFGSDEGDTGEDENIDQEPVAEISQDNLEEIKKSKGKDYIEVII